MKWTWDKFGIHVARPATHAIQMERNPDVILDCLKLTNAPGVRISFYDSLGRAVVTVDATDHNVTLEHTRIASRQSGWDVEVYTAASLDQIKETAVRDFTSIGAVSVELAQALIDHGYFTFDDLSEQVGWVEVRDPRADVSVSYETRGCRTRHVGVVRDTWVSYLDPPYEFHVSHRGTHPCRAAVK